MAYRIETARKTIVIATDREPGHPELDPLFVRFCRGADTLIYDAQYTPEELARRRGWGHGSWRDAVDTARDAGVPDLILTHLDRLRSDDDQDRLVAAAHREYPGARGATEHMTLSL